MDGTSLLLDSREKEPGFKVQINMQNNMWSLKGVSDCSTQ